MTEYQSCATMLPPQNSEQRLSRTKIRTLAAFWILGLCNNYGYVVMLTAAADIIKDQGGGESAVRFLTHLNIICVGKI